MNKTSRSVLLDWVHTLSYMQQSVLIASVRGPDGIRKDHVAKLLLRWLRRCILISAFEGEPLPNPYDPRGGSFTGPSIPNIGATIFIDVADWVPMLNEKVKDYLRTVDELPHHFQLHFMHAAEILGYKHPEPQIRLWWAWVYKSLANDMHLYCETEEEMDKRLGDSEAAWRAREEVTALGPQ